MVEQTQIESAAGWQSFPIRELADQVEKSIEERKYLII